MRRHPTFLHELERAPRSQAPRTEMDLQGFSSSSTSTSDEEEEEAPPQQEEEKKAPPEFFMRNALEAMVRFGARVDVRGTIRSHVTPAQFQKLDEDVQTELAQMLPEDEQKPERIKDAMKNPQIAEFIRLVEESLQQFTPEDLRGIRQAQSQWAWGRRVKEITGARVR